MKRPDSQNVEFDTASDTPRMLEDLYVGTQTIDLNTLFTRDVTSSGSFNMRGVQKTSVGKLLEKLLEALPIPALLLDQSQTILFSNRACGRLCNSSEGLWLAPFSSVFSRPQDAEALQACVERLYIERKPQIIEAPIGIDDRKIWARMHMRSLRLGDERLVLVLIENLTAEKRQVFLAKKYSQSLRKAHDELEGKVRERTAELSKSNEALKREIAVRKVAEDGLYLAARVIASSNEAIIVTDARATIVEVNDAFCHITGYAREDVVGSNPRMMASGRHDSGFWRDFWRALVETGQWRGEVWDRRKNGEVYPKLLSASAVKDETGAVTHYVGIFSDISRLKESERRLEQMAHYDPLTSLPNRLLFHERLNRALIGADRDKNGVGVLFLDLDAFKNVNDTFGHPLGDELLVSVAERLTPCLRKADTIARLGGDEFIVLMPEIVEPHLTARIAERIIEALSKPFGIAGNEIFTSASIGISVYPADGLNADQLLQHADTAMYHAKAQGKNNFQFFSAEMNRAIKKLVEMEMTLRRAMDHNDLLVYHQPIVDAESRQILGTEALLRLRRDGREPMSAGPFIKVAEDKGLIMPIGEWVLRTGCEQNKKWRDMGFPAMRVAVNMSMQQLRHRGIVGTVLRVLEETNQDPRQVELEITESAMMADPDLTIDILSEFRGHGLKISVDDFGTGYSSLSYLKRLPLDKIKIDKSFVDDISSDKAQRAVVEAIIRVAHSLDMMVVAEGVESRTQLDVLRVLNCDALQGYYFSPPVPADEITKILEQGSVIGANGATEEVGASRASKGQGNSGIAGTRRGTLGWLRQWTNGWLR
jgi:diguanylate cyclase (GGDEF)-like protein/PAS domain S-box-containing protein